MSRPLLAFFAGLLALLAGCATTSTNITKILDKMDKAYTPAMKPGSLKTEIATGTFQQDKRIGQLTMKLKAPDKIRMQLVTPKKTIIKGYDGKTAWEFTSDKGVRIVKGEELDEARLQARLLSPSMKMRKLCSSIKLDGTEQVIGKTCWKLVCQPVAELRSQPITLYVDTKTCLIIKMVEIIDTETGTGEVKTYLGDYRNAGGVMCPMAIHTFNGNTLTEIKFKSIKWNKPIDDLDFAPPQSL